LIYNNIFFPLPHSIVNGQAPLIGKSGALEARTVRDTDILTAASLAIAEPDFAGLGWHGRPGRSVWDRWGSKVSTLTVSIDWFRDFMTVVAHEMTVSRLRSPARRKCRCARQ
jgi:hypothetical protein